MNRFAAIVFPAAIAAALLAGCAKSELPAPEEIPSLTKQEFAVSRGMTRTQVEEVFGPPAHLGATKEGHTLAQYEYGYSIRTVIYDGADVVVNAYPPGGAPATQQ